MAPRTLYVFSRASSGGCCCYGSAKAKSRAFATALEAKAALRASLARGTHFRMSAREVYEASFTGLPERKAAAVEALGRGESVEDEFDMVAVNVIGHYMQPKQWDECWSEDGELGTVVITKSPMEDEGDHGGFAHTDILSVTKVEVPE